MDGGCLGIETLVDLVDGRTRDDDRARIEAQASRCATCRDLLSSLARPAGRPDQIDHVSPFELAETGAIEPAKKIEIAARRPDPRLHVARRAAATASTEIRMWAVPSAPP